MVPITSTDPHVIPMRIQLFGAFKMLIDGRPLEPRTPRDLRLLAYLILKRSAPVDRVELAAARWSPNNARSVAWAGQTLEHLVGALSKLSRSLGVESHRLQKPTPQTVRFDTTGADVDYLAWLAALESGRLADLERVAYLYRGRPLLEGWDDAWVLDARGQVKTDYLSALKAAACHARDQDEWAEAERAFALLYELEPRYDDCVVLHLEMLCERRRFTAMAHLYNDSLERSRQEGYALDTRIQSRYRQLRETAERFQGSRENGWLPEPPSRLIPRRDDQREVCELVRANRLTTLTGAGGVGKTRLAIAVAAEMREEFYDRVWFIELADLAAPEQIAARVMRALEINERPGCTPSDLLCEILQPKEALLIFDNCEHLISACALLADRILHACPHVKVLATSRSALNPTYEAKWHVPSLDCPPPDAPWQELERYGAVRLFVERANRPQAPFQVDAANASAVTQICRLLDGIPLALELAAARVNRRLQSAQEVARSLDAPLVALTTGSSTVPERQQTMRAAIAWSYRLLSVEEQTLFARLGVFAGGFTGEAARKVCGDEPLTPEEIEPLMLSLADQSLVEVKSTPSGPRYHLLQVMREFALEQLKAGDAKAVAIARDGQSSTDRFSPVRLRHLRYFADLMKDAGDKLRGPEQAAWLDRLGQEHENLRAALAAALELDEIAVGTTLVVGFASFCYARGFLGEGAEWLDRFLARTPAEPTPQRQRLLHQAGNIAYSREAHARARAFYEESLTILHIAADPRSIAIGQASLANALAGLGEYTEAQALYQTNLAQFQAAGDRRNTGLTLTNLGRLAYEQGDYVSSRNLHAESLKLYRELDDDANIAYSLNNQAGAATMLAEYASARTLLLECYALCIKLGSQSLLVICLTSFIALAFHKGQYEQAALIHGYEKLLRARIDFVLPARSLARYLADLEIVREQLGFGRYEELIAQGRRMSQKELRAALERD